MNLTEMVPRRGRLPSSKEYNLGTIIFDTLNLNESFLIPEGYNEKSIMVRLFRLNSNKVKGFNLISRVDGGGVFVYRNK